MVVVVVVIVVIERDDSFYHDCLVKIIKLILLQFEWNEWFCIDWSEHFMLQVESE